MNLAVGSYLELYTTVFGWMIYGLIWDLLVLTMIVFLPIGWIIADNWRSAVTSGDERPPASISVKKTAIDLAIAFFVIFIAAVPMYTLTPGIISYSPAPSYVTPTPTTVTRDSDPTTYKTSLGSVETGTVQIPVWWWVTSAISTGISNSIAQALPNEGDIRVAQQQVAQVNITDPQTKAEYGQFISDCFAPARAKLQTLISRKGQDNLPAGISDAIDEYGNADLEWAGSQAYLNSEGFYLPSSNTFETGAGFRARGPVDGFPGDTERERELDLAGKPWCADWWLGNGGPGLREKLLVETAPNDSLWERMKTSRWIARLAGYTDAELDDARIRNLLKQTAANQITQDYTYAYQTTSTGPIDWASDKIGGILGRAVNTVAIGTASVVFNTVLDGVKMLIPMQQAVMLMGIYALLPFILVIAAYRWEYLFLLTLVVFSFHFLTAIWAIANFIDQYLVEALFPTDASFANFFFNDATGALDKRMLLDILTGGLFLGLPFLWFFLIAAVGFGAFRGAGQLSGKVSPKAQGATEAGGESIGRRAKL